jgi:chemotaxis protein methyltransferase CheR
VDRLPNEVFNNGIRAITPEEFNRFRDLIYQQAGISMAPQKRLLVAGRLQKRLRHHGLTTYTDYLSLLEDPQNSEERQMLVDLLTTNETYFYREPAHFEFLRQHILPLLRGRTVRVWSAACASGEEVYTLAMSVADILGMGDWVVMGSDISERVLEQARSGIYPLERARDLPSQMLSTYCLKGVRTQTGFLLIEPRIKQRVQFQKINLMRPLPYLQPFDVVFLRNVLIYFDGPTKQKVVRRVVDAIKPGGYLFTSHVESLHGVIDTLQMLRPSVFLKPNGRS